MAKRIIKNEYVKMEWDADLFFESKERDCLIAAIQMYPVEGKENNVPVIFMDKKAFMLIDEDTGEICPMDDILWAIKKCFKDGEIMEDFAYDNYLPVTDGFDTNEEGCEKHGLNADQIKDICDRLDDLTNGYWCTVEEEF